MIELCFKFKWNAKFQHVTDSISLSSLPYPIVALKLTAISRQRVCEVKPLGRAGYFYFQFARRTCIPSTSQNRSMWKRPFLDGNEYSREDTVADGSKRAWKPSARGWVPFWKQLAQRLPHRVIKRAGSWDSVRVGCGCGQQHCLTIKSVERSSETESHDTSLMFKVYWFIFNFWTP